MTYLVNQGNAGGGAFCNFMTVLGALNLYEQGKYTGVEVDFVGGLFHDPQWGPNWWEYHFEPIKVGDLTTPKETYINKTSWTLSYQADSKTSRIYNHYLINKYIKLRPELQDYINTLASNLFGNNATYNNNTGGIIGVHYRGTDKDTEANVVGYEKYGDEIAKYMRLWPGNSFKIFIATDEHSFIEYMVGRFGDLAVFVDNTYRASNRNPIHYMTNQQLSSVQVSRYELGRSAIIDCYLLARAKVLIRSSSNLSLVSSLININQHVIEMTKRNW